MAGRDTMWKPPRAMSNDELDAEIEKRVHNPKRTDNDLLLWDLFEERTRRIRRANREMRMNDEVRW